MLDRFVKDIREGRDHGQAETDRPKRAQTLVLDVGHGLAGVFNSRVDCERRQTHGRNRLEHGPLGGNKLPVVEVARGPLVGSDLLGRQLWRRAPRHEALLVQTKLLEPRLPRRVGDIANQVRPTNTVTGTHKVRVGNRAKGLSNIRRVCNVSVTCSENCLVLASFEAMCVGFAIMFFQGCDAQTSVVSDSYLKWPSKENQLPNGIFATSA